MHLPALKQVARAVQGLAGERRVLLLGSGALLAQCPGWGEGGGPLEMTYDADVLLDPSDEEMAAVIHEAVGEGSLFARQTGHYADVLRPEIRRMFPEGWESRVLPLEGVPEVGVVAVEDVLVAKLRVGRKKDLELCQLALEQGLVEWEILKLRLDGTPMQESEVRTVFARLEVLRG